MNTIQLSELTEHSLQLYCSECRNETTDWTARIRIPARAKIFIFAVVSRPTLRPQPPIQCVSGVKRLEHETPSNAEFKNARWYTLYPKF